MIEQDLREQRRHITRMAEVFAASPEAVAPEGCKPPLGTFITKAQEPYATAAKAPKPKAKRTTAKDAKPNVAAELQNARPAEN